MNHSVLLNKRCFPLRSSVTTNYTWFCFHLEIQVA